MPIRGRPFAAFALAIALLVGAAARAAGITSGGIAREYEIFLPNSTSGPRPAVFLLHGGGGTAAEMRRYTGFDRIAEESGIVAVYPQGLDLDWADGPSLDGRTATRDSQFLLDLAERLVAMGVVDPRRIYVAGISNGGIMALRMACFHADRIAGVAAVAASLPAGSNCRPARSLPVIFINGTADRLVPFAGDRARIMPVAQSIDVFARRDGCRLRHSQMRPAPVPPEGTRALLYDYGGCAPGGALASVVVEGGGHGWPGARPGATMANVESPASRAIDANLEIWRFFARHPPLP